MHKYDNDIRNICPPPNVIHIPGTFTGHARDIHSILFWNLVFMTYALRTGTTPYLTSHPPSDNLNSANPKTTTV